MGHVVDEVAPDRGKPFLAEYDDKGAGRKDHQEQQHYHRRESHESYLAEFVILLPGKIYRKNIVAGNGIIGKKLAEIFICARTLAVIRGAVYYSAQIAPDG